MGFAAFIAKRILRRKEAEAGGQLSKPIVGIAVAGIVVGMAVMIVTVAITAGFQGEVRRKVLGAGGHLQITSLRQTDPKETPRIPIDVSFYPSLDTLPGIAHIQIYATKPGIIETDEDIQGVVVKGVGMDHDWQFLAQHLIAGELPAIGDSTRPIDLLLSRYQAERLRIGALDTITVYLVRDREDIRPRRFRVSGIYETGLEQLDHQMVYVDIGHLQRFSQWGLKAEILVYDSLSTQGTHLEGLAFGGDRVYRYSWPGTSLHGRGPHWIKTDGDTSLMLVVSDADQTIPDTAWIRITPKTAATGHPWLSRDQVEIAHGGSGGSHTKYCGGFEVALERYEDLLAMDDRIYRDHLDMSMRSLTAHDRFPELFAWLRLLDKNVIVVVVLMIIVAMINMTSALLIIILERTSMIGILKAMGSTSSAIRRIFLIDAAYLLGIGILLGDLLGVGLCLLQKHYGIVRLPVETYYVDAVPVVLDWPAFALLNAITLVICLLALLVPSTLVARIAPAKAIRFN